MMHGKENPADVVVVGAGNAAFTAALAARRAGCEVVVLEKAPEPFRGGNTRFTGGVFRFTYDGLDDLLPIVKDTDDASDVVVDPYPAEAFERDLQRVTGGRADPLLSRVLIERSYETVRWMADLGVRFEFSRAVTGMAIPGTNKTRLQPGVAIRAYHEGIGLSQTLFDLAAAHGVEVLYERQVSRILSDDAGRVIGVEARGPQGLERHYGRAVIAAGGGFQANPEMRTAYMGGPWGLVKARGSRYNTGEVLRELLAIGAQSFGDWAGRHATPIDADAPAYGDLKLTDKTNRLSYPYGVLINLDGERFVDEGADFNSYTYAAYGAAILAQRNATAFEIFDSRAFSLLEKRYETGTPVEAGEPRRAGRRDRPPLSVARLRRGGGDEDIGRLQPGGGPQRRVRSGRARRQAHPRLAAGEDELGGADRNPAVPRLCGDRRDHLHLWRHPDQRQRRGARRRRPPDPRPLRQRRIDRRVLFHQLPARLRPDPRRRLRQARRRGRRSAFHREVIINGRLIAIRSCRNELATPGEPRYVSLRKNLVNIAL